MKPSKDTQNPPQTPFEKAAHSRTKRNMLVVSYALALQVIGESIRASGTIDDQAVKVLVAIAKEAESRLGISA